MIPDGYHLVLRNAYTGAIIDEKEYNIVEPWNKKELCTILFPPFTYNIPIHMELIKGVNP